MTRRAPAPKADRERARIAGEYADELYQHQRAYGPREVREYWVRSGGAGTAEYVEALRAAHDAAEVAADAFEAAHQEQKMRTYRARAKRIRKMLDSGTPHRDPPARRRPSDRPRSAEGNENLAYLLDRDVRAIGPESDAAPPARDVRLLISPSGSYRYVALENGRPVSALQIQSRDGVRGVVMNVYTTPAARRRGWAARLLEVARRRFREVKHADDLTSAGEAWKNTVRDVARDKDYRGQPVPFDFARAVFEVRRQRPGALEVLQDGIEEWFPRQYADAVAEAAHDCEETGMPWVVLFNARVARGRFRRPQDVRSMIRTPFDIHLAAPIARNGMPPYSAIVWQCERVRKPTRRMIMPTSVADQAYALLGEHDLALQDASATGDEPHTDRPISRSEAVALIRALEAIGVQASGAPDNDDPSVVWVYITLPEEA